MVHFNGRPPELLSITLAPCRTDFWSADDTRLFRIADGSMAGAHGDTPTTRLARAPNNRTHPVNPGGS